MKYPRAIISETRNYNWVGFSGFMRYLPRCPNNAYSEEDSMLRDNIMCQ